MRPFPVLLDTLPTEGKTFSLEIDSVDADRALAEGGAEDVHVSGRLTARIRLLPSGGDVFLVGDLRGRVRYECVRCLVPFEEDLDERIHVTLAEEEKPGKELELRSEDLELEPLQDGELDLARVVIEQLYLALRPHPVCGESCKGLCPVCGVDLNAAPCGCTRRVADPRLAVLEKWDRDA